VNAREYDIEGDYTDIDLVSISSVTCNLSFTVISNSPIYDTKKVQKRKAGDEVARPSSAHEKRPRTVAASDISLARNPVSHISLYGKSGAKSMKHRGLKFHVSVKLSWDYGGNKRDISIEPLIDSGAEATIFDADFVEQTMMPWVKREKRLRLEDADDSLLNRSGMVRVQNIQMEVPDARLEHDKTLDLVAEVACREPGCPLILGFDRITAHCEKVRVTECYGLELKCAFETEDVIDFLQFGEIL